MNEFLDHVAKVSVLIFVVTSMAAAGFTLRPADLVAPFRRVRLVLLALAANFVVVPGAAYGLTELFALHRPYAIALLLLAGAAGAPFLPKLVEVAKGDLAFSVGLMLLLMIGSIIFMPIVLPLLIPGLSADPWPILKPLLLTMLLPLAAAMLMRSRSEHWAAHLQPGFKLVSNLSMLLAVALLIVLNFKAMAGTFGTGAVALALLLVAIGIVAGYLLGGQAHGTRTVVSLGTGQRNIAAALVIGTQNFNDPDIVAMLLVTTFAGLALLLFAARWCARRSTASPLVSSASQHPPPGEPVAEDIKV